MKIKRFVRDALVVGTAFVGLQVLQTMSLRDAMEQQNRLLNHRLGVSAAGIFNQAHKAKDDLLLYQTICALAQSPGILQACIIDPENKILAHRDPSRLGRLFTSSQDMPGTSLFSLKEADKPWGRLVLSFSDHFTRALVRKQCLIGTAAAACVWGIIFFYLQYTEKKIFDLRVRIEELNGLFQGEKRRLSASEERAQMAGLQAAASLQKAVRLISEPLLILDAQQRLAAINEPAMNRLGIAKAEPFIGKSWNEIPVLDCCGTGLQRSLTFPGGSVLCPTKTGDFQLRFETDADGLAGTWVTLI